jgi:hypothetical protein
MRRRESGSVKGVAHMFDFFLSLFSFWRNAMADEPVIVIMD